MARLIKEPSPSLETGPALPLHRDCRDEWIHLRREEWGATRSCHRESFCSVYIMMYTMSTKGGVTMATIKVDVREFREEKQSSSGWLKTTSFDSKSPREPCLRVLLNLTAYTSC